MTAKRKRGRPKMEVCWFCDGTKKAIDVLTKKEEECSVCEGRGKVYAADED